jgi:hypothetical protein
MGSAKGNFPHFAWFSANASKQRDTSNDEEMQMGEAPEHLKPYLIKKGDPPPERKNPPVRGGLARSTRTLIGDEGRQLVELWWSIANDPLRRDADRLEASKLLADRGWGRAANFVAQEGDPLGLEDAEHAAEEFRRRILRLAPEGAEGDAAEGGAEPPALP